MSEPIMFFLGFLVIVSLLVFRTPILYSVRKLRREFWHHWFIWKIERKLAKTSVEKEKTLFEIS